MDPEDLLERAAEEPFECDVCEKERPAGSTVFGDSETESNWDVCEYCYFGKDEEEEELDAAEVQARMKQLELLEYERKAEESNKTRATEVGAIQVDDGIVAEGLRVVRGVDWRSGHAQDGGPGGRGTIVGFTDANMMRTGDAVGLNVPSHARVVWDITDATGNHMIGYGGKFTLNVCPDQTPHLRFAKTQGPTGVIDAYRTAIMKQQQQPEDPDILKVCLGPGHNKHFYAPPPGMKRDFVSLRAAGSKKGGFKAIMKKYNKLGTKDDPWASSRMANVEKHRQALKRKPHKPVFGEEWR